LVNSAGNPATPWRTIPAPVPVPDACSETCHPPHDGALTTPPRCFPLRTARKCWNSPQTGRERSASPPMLGRRGGPIPDLLRNSCGLT
jgi:hypothetical protein